MPSIPLSVLSMTSWTSVASSHSHSTHLCAFRSYSFYMTTEMKLQMRLLFWTRAFRPKCSLSTCVGITTAKCQPSISKKLLRIFQTQMGWQSSLTALLEQERYLLNAIPVQPVLIYFRVLIFAVSKESSSMESAQKFAKHSNVVVVVAVIMDLLHFSLSWLSPGYSNMIL